MRELFRGMNCQFVRNVHISRTLQHLRIVHICDDRLIFAGQIFVQVFDQLVAGERGLVSVRHCFSLKRMRAQLEAFCLGRTLPLWLALNGMMV